MTPLTLTLNSVCTSFFQRFFVLFFHVCSWASTAFVSAVCKGLRPSLDGCPEKMKTLIIKCWSSEASERPCKFIFLFSFPGSTFLFHCFFVSFQQRSRPLSRGWKNSSNLFFFICVFLPSLTFIIFIDRKDVFE